jgi:hypothetical protein
MALDGELSAPHQALDLYCAAAADTIGNHGTPNKIFSCNRLLLCRRFVASSIDKDIVCAHEIKGKNLELIIISR